MLSFILSAIGIIALVLLLSWAIGFVFSLGFAKALFLSIILIVFVAVFLIYVNRPTK